MHWVAWGGLVAYGLAAVVPGTASGVIPMAGLFAAVTVAMALWRHPDPRLVLLPSLLFALLTTLLFVILPGLIPAEWRLTAEFVERAHRGEGALATRILAGLSAMLLAHGLIVAAKTRPRTDMAVRKPAQGVLWAIVGVTVALLALYGYGFNSPRDPLRPLLGSFLASQVYDAILPLAIYVVAALVVVAAVRARALVLAVGTAGVLTAVVAVTLTIKIPLIAILSAGLATVRRLQGRAMVLVVIMLGACAVTGAAAVWIMRFERPANAEWSSTDVLASLVRVKVAHRFVTTYMCFSSTLEQHAGTQGPPLYFAYALVPRFLWEDKPNLSRGDEYSQLYCGAEIAEKTWGSMSVTILGEPMIEAGPTGAVVAALTLVCFLAGFSALCFRLNGPGLAWMVAMAPWLWDIDQAFALYLAGSLKAALIMSPLVFAWWKWDRRA